jgi:hypothetical protein
LLPITVTLAGTSSTRRSVRVAVTTTSDNVATLSVVNVFTTT